MNIQGNIKKIEVTIWESLISLMTTSPRFQKILRTGFDLVKDHEIIWLAGLILAWTAAGLTVGYFMGFDGLR
jgi:hypothetical protein